MDTVHRYMYVDNFKNKLLIFSFSSASSKRSSLKRGAPPPPSPSDGASGQSPTKSTDVADSKTVSHKQTESASGSSKQHEETTKKKTVSSGSNKQKESAPPLPTRTSSIKESQPVDSYVSDLPNGITQSEKTNSKRQITDPETANLLHVKQVQGGEATDSSMPVSLSMKSLPNSPSRNFSSPALINVKTIAVPPNFNSEVVEEVRKHTGLSYDKSCIAVEVVLSHVANTIPQIAGMMDKILVSLHEVGFIFKFCCTFAVF